MFKKIFTLTIALFVYVNVNAQQSYRVYLTQSGERTTHTEIASSYAIISYLPEDSLWSVQQFDMGSNMLISGYYKDEKMTIAHGKFTYYRKDKAYNIDPVSNQNTFNYIQLTGYFLNGARTGPWVEYSQGIKISVTNFKNDKMDGLYQQFDKATGKVIKEGYYVNNFKEGDWCMLDVDSTAIFTDIFKHGKVIKQLTHSNPIVDKERAKEFAKNNKAAVPNFDFQTLVDRTFQHYNNSLASGKFVMTFTITKEGRVTEPKIVETFEAQFDEMATQAMLNTRWKPAISNGQPVNQIQTITINVRDGVAQVPGGNLHKSYNLEKGTYQ
ncbi:MAG TPA: energy transducer TonB [Mucilaginibacter sp.]|nr:energy transducer TonB [Mucilaginibacter sp.]